MQKITAKLRVVSVEEQFIGPDNSKSGESVHLTAVYSADKTSENYSFSQATPMADVKMFISNPNAFGAFPGGAEVCVEFTPIGVPSTTFGEAMREAGAAGEVTDSMREEWM